MDLNIEERAQKGIFLAFQYPVEIPGVNITPFLQASISSKLTKRYEDSRLSVSNFINAPSLENIIFTKSATEGINLVSSCLSQDYFEDGDEILLSSLEHHANLIPWPLISKKIKIISANLNSNGELDYNDLINKINNKTKLVTLTHMSNVTGSITNFEEIKIKKRN